MNEPTDAELRALLPTVELDRKQDPKVQVWLTQKDAFAFALRVLAKWGTPPAVAGEPVGWMWQHDETGRTGFVDCWQVENGWQENNPRLRLVSRLYTTPQPTQAQAGAVPLTDEQIEVATGAKIGTPLFLAAKSFVLATEAAHGIGIKGGQHGAE